MNNTHAIAGARPRLVSRSASNEVWSVEKWNQIEVETRRRALLADYEGEL